MLVTAGNGGAAEDRTLSRTEATTLRVLAELTLRRAGRPAGADPRTVAAAIGMRAFPCAEEDAEELVGAHAEGFRWAWSDDERVRRRRVWEGLASALLVRVRMGVTAERVGLLVEALSGA